MRLSPAMFAALFEGLDWRLVHSEEARRPQRAASSPPRRNLGRLPAHLPRVELIIEPRSARCPCGCDEMAEIGEDVSERLDVIPAQLRVLVTRRPKYA